MGLHSMHAVWVSPRARCAPPSPLVSPVKDRQQQQGTMQAQLTSVARIQARPLTVVRAGAPEPCTPRCPGPPGLGAGRDGAAAPWAALGEAPPYPADRRTFALPPQAKLPRAQRAQRMIVRAAAVSADIGPAGSMLGPLNPPITPLNAPRLAPALQDKGQVLSDVRSIIAEQLGTDLDKVRRRCRCRRPRRARARLPLPL